MGVSRRVMMVVVRGHWGLWRQIGLFCYSITSRDAKGGPRTAKGFFGAPVSRELSASGVKKAKSQPRFIAKAGRDSHVAPAPHSSHEFT